MTRVETTCRTQREAYSIKVSPEEVRVLLPKDDHSLGVMRSKVMAELISSFPDDL